jgi:hypothetical protein
MPAPVAVGYSAVPSSVVTLTPPVQDHPRTDTLDSSVIDLIAQSAASTAADDPRQAGEQRSKPPTAAVAASRAS